MKRVPAIFLAGIALLLSGCASTAGLTGNGNAQRGAFLFLRDGCVSCHEVNGIGGTIAQPLTGNLAMIDYTVLRSTILNPPRGMERIRFFRFTPADIHDLATFGASKLRPSPVP